ncbi:hypothetical protein BB561_005900 [Smittium simulii]|uniref:Uncharacterized protein n=1 Tax=Smittium simulii TaxID=133385 RepID=A0A2T9Y7T2_9FUNG|nr:hypothetical protein BB561_005900 [Smittium simulii]
MKALLIDIALTVAQARIINSHTGLSSSEKLIELIKAEVKSLINQEDLDSFLAKKQTLKRQRARPFCKRQQYIFTTYTYSRNTATASNTSAAITEAGFSSKKSDCQANFVEGVAVKGGGLNRYSKRSPHIVKKGFRISFKSSHSPESNDTNYRAAPAFSDAQETLAKVKIRSKHNLNKRSGILSGKKCYKRSSTSKPGFYSFLFTITKKAGGLRPVLELRNLNKYVAD